VVGAVKPARAVADEPPMPPEKRLGWAIVGLGKFATQQLIPSFSECKGQNWSLVSGEPTTKAERIARQYGVTEEYLQLPELRHHPEQS